MLADMKKTIFGIVQKSHGWNLLKAEESDKVTNVVAMSQV
jgi:hypothetical protein